MNSKIDLSQFVGKTVDVTLRSGRSLFSVLVETIASVGYPYIIAGECYKRDGYWDYSRDDLDDIVKIQLSTPEQPMDKYDKLEFIESKIAELQTQTAEFQKEVERLKNLENEEKEEELPDSFIREFVIKVLNGDRDYLGSAFLWCSTPQGDKFWRENRDKRNTLTNEAIIQLQKWVIKSYEQEFGK